MGGLLADGKAAFPNAVVRMDKRDADFWLSADEATKAPADSKGFFQGAQAAVKPYQDAGRVKPFSGDTELVSGVRAIAAPGHTPGHTIYAADSTSWATPSSPGRRSTGGDSCSPASRRP